MLMWHGQVSYHAVELLTYNHCYNITKIGQYGKVFNFYDKFPVHPCLKIVEN